MNEKNYLMLYGAGENAKIIYKRLKDKYNIACIVDKDEAKHGTIVMPDDSEYAVLSLKNALNQFPKAKLWITPKSPLKYEIMHELLNGYNNIKVDKELILNFDPDVYNIYYPISKSNENVLFAKVGDNNSLYVENIKSFAEACKENYRLEESTEEIRIVENGFILPPKFTHIKQGGVCDAEQNFIDGHISFSSDASITSSYQVQEGVNHVRETVVYGGVVNNHFGHFIVESLSRMWFFLENRECEYKFVFINHGSINEVDYIRYIDFFLLLGLKEENIILLKEPTRFDKIIVPSQTTYIITGFKNKAIAIYNAIRDSVVPASYEKVYLTRTKLPTQDIINEEYFENYYRSIGYEIIAMESLSIREQISIMAGAKNIVCTHGTLQHHILFSNDGVNVTILNRSHYLNPPIFWINQARNAKCVFIDVYLNFLPTLWHDTAWYLMPTAYWKQYVNDSGGKLEETFNNPELCIKYIEAWTRKMVNVARRGDALTSALKEFTLADVIIGLYEKLLGGCLDESAKKKIHATFSKNTPASTANAAVSTVYEQLCRFEKECEIKNYFLQLDENISDPEIIEIANYFKKGYDFSVFPYESLREYRMNNINVFWNSAINAWYIEHQGKKLYFPEDWTAAQVRNYYNSLCMEQDKYSPHCYEAGEFLVQQGDVIADIGAAEGIWALNYAENASKIYLFECDKKWINALQKTFEPWKEKVIIVNKYVSDTNNSTNVTLDSFFGSEQINFIKADIEGMESKLLRGSKNMLVNNNDLKLLLCTYHKKNDEAEIEEILKKNGFRTEFSRGYMLFIYDKELEKPYLRRGLLRAAKSKI